MKLIIGNKNYSSWSLRPWLLLRAAGIEFEEVLIPLYREDSKARQLAYSPAGKVPALIDGEITVWDSLAIVEYLAEKFPDRGIWPRDPAARTRARSICAEMHSGFPALRNSMPMNLRGRHPGCGRTPETLADIARIVAVWEDCRAYFGAGGAFLFGAFCAADVFYAPVVTRFVTYDVQLPPTAAAYRDAVLALSALREWTAAGATEPERIAMSELYA
ncbi:MAG: glutathione S-transferase family protein [Gammaproteobacteria bacterium]|nr:glutathione S-transferase family protein [Gammaproteobacteria bacterium]